MCGKFRVAIAINLRNYVPAGSLDRFKFTHKIRSVYRFAKVNSATTKRYS